MELLFLGSGGGIRTVDEGTPPNYNSNMVLSHNNQKLLIDCGIDIKYSLPSNNLVFTDFSDIYISHLHFDHIGGLEWLALSSKFIAANKHKPNLHTHHSLVDLLWENSLKAGLSTLDDAKAELATYFNVHPITDDNKFQWHGISFDIVRTLHMYSDHNLMPSFGLFFKGDNQTVFLTTDTRFTPDLFEPYYEKADIIFHDCEVSTRPSGVHTHYNQLKTLPTHIRNKIWLYHYDSKELPNAEEDGFKGFVKCGQTFEI